MPLQLPRGVTPTLPLRESANVHLYWYGLILFGVRNVAISSSADGQVPLANLPTCLDGYSLAMISDIHAGPTVGRDEVRRALYTP